MCILCLINGVRLVKKGRSGFGVKIIGPKFHFILLVEINRAVLRIWDDGHAHGGFMIHTFAIEYQIPSHQRLGH